MKEYENILKQKNQQKRIEIVLTDSYNDDEADNAFCCYLEEYISFPFKARIRGRKKSAIFTVLKFTSVTPHRVVCEIDIYGVKSRMPLTEIEPLEKRSPNEIVISDYLEFIGE